MAQNYERTMKQGDTGEPVRVHVVNDSNGQEPDWSSASVTFKLLSIDPDTGALTEVINAPASVELPTDTSGTLVYVWQPGDTDALLGRYMATFRVDDPTLGIEHYPREGYIWITIEQDGAT